MELGYRIIRKDDVGALPLRLAQISLWRVADWGVAEGDEAAREAVEMAAACRARSVSTVFHPLEYPLTGDLSSITLDVLHKLADAADLGIIIHDEGGSGGQRLTAAAADEFESHVREISRRCHLSLENSYNSGDITWFWERFVDPLPDSVSATLDIGHLELAGIDSVSFVQNLPPRLVERIAFVHMHHYDGQGRNAVKDHRPLVPGCREIDALKSLLARKADVRVILELDAREDGMLQSVDLLKNL